ncbi:tRNA-dependent cyclodipeptide synthase [Patescibacteria group bacterium]|nr:tRNA-dependent cyclodipeptide synthase [Patescibacteria group bacterium]MBU1922424.1 tRNA-dependent cyclodipeptide synthase [Patescibacteria group bacterium]
MIIKKILGATEDEVRNKKFNIFLGISLGNKYFTKFRIKKYLEWALENTKDSVLVLIADELHAVNSQVLKNYDKEKSIKLTIKAGADIANCVQKIVNSFPEDKRQLIRVIRWGEITQESGYKILRSKIYNEFKKNNDFKEYILEIVKTHLGEHAPDEPLKIESLARYVLDELPLLLNGVRFEDRHYTLLPYPGLSKLDELVYGLHHKKMFPSLSEELGLITKTVIVEAYVE